MEQEDTVTLSREGYEHLKKIEANSVHVERLLADGEKIDAVIAGDIVRLIATGLFAYMQGTGAQNYVELKLQHPEYGTVVLTLQKREGKTPHELRMEAEAERDQLLLIAGLVDPEKRGEAEKLIQSYVKRMEFELRRADTLGSAVERIRAGEPEPEKIAEDAMRRVLTMGGKRDEGENGGGSSETSGDGTTIERGPDGSTPGGDSTDSDAGDGLDEGAGPGDTPE